MIIDLSPSILPAIVQDDTAACLSDTLAPWSGAAVGDLLAIELGLRVPAAAFHAVATGATTLHVRSERGIAFGSYRSLLRDSLPARGEKAHAAMMAIGDPLYERAALPALLAMDPDTGEDFQARAILLSTCLAITHADLDWAIEDGGKTIGEIDISDHLDIATTSPGSQHDRLRHQQGLSSDMEILTRILDLSDEDGNRVSLRASLPAHR